MKKDVASQKVFIYAWDTANSEPKTGDAGNITAQISKDGGGAAGTDTANPTELDAVNLKGIYYFPLLKEETNCDIFVLSPVSGTADIGLEPVIIHTTEEADIKAKTDNLPGAPAATGEYDTEMGRIDQNLSTTEANIIAEVDVNEGKIDAVKTDTAAILVDTDTMEADIITQVNANETKLDLLQADSTRMLGLLFNNSVWEFTYDGNQKQTGGKIYNYDTALNATANGKTVGTGLIAEYTVVIAVNGDGDPTSMKVTKVS